MSDFKKFDDNKPMMELLEPQYMIGIAMVLTLGAKKYSVDNWKNATPKDERRIKGATLRHLMAYNDGERFDPETGLSHLYHVSCNLMFLDYFDRALENDDNAEEHS